MSRFCKQCLFFCDHMLPRTLPFVNKTNFSILLNHIITQKFKGKIQILTCWSGWYNSALGVQRIAATLNVLSKYSEEVLCALGQAWGRVGQVGGFDAAKSGPRHLADVTTLNDVAGDGGATVVRRGKPWDGHTVTWLLGDTHGATGRGRALW